MLHPEYPVVSFLSVFLLLCSVPSHIRARNIATISLHLWLGVLSIIRGINSIAWADNVEIKLLVWCDITTKIDIGFTLAVPASALCLMMHLESIASSRSVQFTEQDKRRRRILEFVMCFVIPIIFMGLHYIVQGHRFDIYQDQGCFPTIYVSLAAIFILWLPPLVFACISFIFAALSLRHFLRHRISFSSRLHNGSAISPQRYFRLMLLALVEMIWDLGTNIWILWFNVSVGLRPYTNWDDVHFNFSRVQQYPYILLPQSIINADTFIWWILPVSCLLVFILFGTGREAIADYRTVFNWLRRTVLRQKVTSNPSSSPLSSMAQTLPTTGRSIHVSIPFARRDVSGSETEDSPIKPTSFRSSSGQTFDRRSSSRSSVSTKARSEVSLALPPALPIPAVDSEADVLNDAPALSLSRTSNVRVPSYSGLEVSVPDPFSSFERLPWRSDPALPPCTNNQSTLTALDSDAYNTVNNEISPV